ncbi:MAG: hypothetical protein Ct9H90mP25_0610 [Gammaproteobacteria bacterium]|nr:MAG: hypothetical protein Ct9H90mP25_0610 [Gammaproteobacteria bacterium]
MRKNFREINFASPNISHFSRAISVFDMHLWGNGQDFLNRVIGFMFAFTAQYKSSSNDTSSGP